MQVRTWFGIFTLDNGRIVNVELFQKDTDSILNRISSEQVLLWGQVAGTDLRDLAVTYGFVESKEEYDRILHEINITHAKRMVAQAMAGDKVIIGAVEAIDDIDETANILAERLKEWYMILFGETHFKGKELACYIKDIQGTGHGPELGILQSYSTALLELYGTRLTVEEYLKETMLQIAPNLTNIAGHILGARLLSIAGSLERLASMPSSTIQVIGANNALFKHLKGKAPSPKHGLIFRHPLINTAPKKLRGKIARAVASKIAFAARYDFYSGELKEDLPGELEAKVRNIKN